MKELGGKVVVITGGAGGIGRALAECFLDEGAKVMLGDLDPASLQVAADELATRRARLPRVWSTSPSRRAPTTCARPHSTPSVRPT